MSAFTFRFLNLHRKKIDKKANEAKTYLKMIKTSSDLLWPNAFKSDANFSNPAFTEVTLYYALMPVLGFSELE